MTQLVDALRDRVALDVLDGHSLGVSHGIQRTRVRSSSGEWLVKSARGPSDQLAAEADGLAALHSAATKLVVPDAAFYSATSADDESLLLIPWLTEDPDENSDAQSRFLGSGLADLHGSTGPAFGYSRNNYIGLGSQPNGFSESWPTFFRDARLRPMATVARSTGRWPSHWDRPLDALLHRLPDILPESPQPALLHGDLWSGNYLRLTDGRAAVIDPAVYYGHFEVDLAMTTLFGGFDAAFYGAYYGASRQGTPDTGWEDRKAVYNLYHLINHLNIFGGGYASQVIAVLNRFTG